MSDSQGDKEVVHVLERMGCTVDYSDNELTISGPDHLTSCEIDLNATPDALPALAVTACFAEGTTRLVNVPQAREKETDRIAVMRTGGKVAQYATPAELLMSPADEFVEDFVGADRALKRLALMRVADIDLWTG